MTIHIVASRADRHGGAEIYTVGLATALHAAGHDVALLCHEGSVGTVYPFRVIEIPTRSHASHWRRWLDFRKSIKALPINEPDVIVAMNHLMSYWHWRRFKKVPVVYLPHSLTAYEEVLSGFPERSLQGWMSATLWRWLERQAIRRATTIVRFTAFAAKALELEYGAPLTDRLRILPPPVNPAASRTAAKYRGNEPVHLLSMGRLVGSKNVALTLRSLAGLPGHLLWRMDIVGDGNERGALEALCHSLHIDDRVTFQGHRDDVDTFYRQSDLLVFPSRRESAGLVVLEAMSHGVPALLVASDERTYRSAAGDFVDEGVNGFIAPTEADFPGTLQRLIEEPAILAAAGVAAISTVMERHNWSHHIDLWNELLTSATTAGQPI